MIFEELFERYPVLSVCREDILEADAIIRNCYQKGGKLLICGNGGSCADACHIVGELMKGFLRKRPLTQEKKAEMLSRFPVSDDLLNCLQGALPAIALSDADALTTAFNNDVNPLYTYAQQVYALSCPNDVLVGISTSGNAKNVACAVSVAKGLGLRTIGLTGNTGGYLKKNCDTAICVPEKETFKIQELHLPVYHALCASAEDCFFPE